MRQNVEATQDMDDGQLLQNWNILKIFNKLLIRNASLQG